MNPNSPADAHPRRSRARNAVLSLATLATLALSVSLVGAQPLSASAASLSGVVQPSPNTVTADALPTVQIDGVVWAQAVVGNTVYAGGEFANARPAGAAAGTNLTPRGNLLAYDITTGNLITSFAPVLNSAVRAIAASPDGKRIYVGGGFTTANGANRYRLAAYDTATGALVSSFAPVVNTKVYSIVATNTTVYVGGAFTSAGSPTGSVVRTRLAAFNAANGALLPWAPTADNTVSAMVMTPDSSKLIVGGHFQTINGATASGLAALDPSTGTQLPWAATSTISDSGNDSGITSLTTDGTNIYGSGYVYNSGTGNLEGSFAADASTGAIAWIEDCHGDSYSMFPSNGTVYLVGHPYACSGIGAFDYPATSNDGPYHRALAFTTQATGTISMTNFGGYGYFGGQPSPSMVNWFPSLISGSYTGQGQAAWSVAGNSKYVVLGGEFPKVNGTAQQGLTRFAVASVAKSKQGPRLSSATFPITVTQGPGTSVKINWTGNWDRDDLNLVYTVIRDGKTATPIYTSAPTASTFWNYGTVAMSYTDPNLNIGSHTYKVFATDPSGNTAGSSLTTISVTAPALVAASASASSSVEAWGWGVANLIDGTSTSTSSDMGWSSSDNTGVSHTETATIDLGAATSVGRVLLSPRTDGANLGYGFPVDYTIAVSTEGTTWTNVVSVTGAAMPSGSVSASFSSTSARYIRVTGSTLRANPNDGNQYRMQFAEISAFSQ